MDSTKGLGKNVSLDEVERMEIAKAINLVVKNGGAKGFESYEALKSALNKIGFQPEEVEILKARGRAQAQKVEPTQEVPVKIKKLAKVK